METGKPSPRKIKVFVQLLMEWGENNLRDFEWRKEKDAYRVLIAEILLQKTDVKKVAEVYPKFIDKYPNIEAISKASLQEISQLLKPLGIYNEKAERLKKIAKIILEAHDGKIPKDKEKLRNMPGIGNYISNAVLCLAFNEDLPMLDTNSIRVINRVFGISSSKSRPRTDENYWQLLEKMMPKGKGKEFNLALLDFGSLVCTARKPKCPICPLKNICRAYNASDEIEKAKG